MFCFTTKYIAFVIIIDVSLSRAYVGETWDI